MWHKRRVWTVADVATAGELAEKLTAHDWCGCQGFRLGGYLFLNDSTSADGAQEYAVCKADGTQIESITFGWMHYGLKYGETAAGKALAYINAALAGEYDTEDYGRIDLARVETPQTHGRCGLCA